MEKQKIKIVRKNDEYSAEYQVGDVFQVDSTWYGGVNVTSASGIPLSLDKDEYVLLEEAEQDLEAMRELRYEPEYYQDYRKMEELDAKIDDKHNEIAALMQEWEEKMAMLE